METQAPIAIPAWQRAMSYIRPQILASYSSPYNPVLELTLEDGKLVLNTALANFSYGSLQQAFARFFRSYGLQKHRVRQVLLLGLGAGSVAELIWQTHPQAQITGVELDPVVVQVGSQYFAPMRDPRLRVVVGDALNFALTCQQQYDLVVVDVFQELQVAAAFIDPTFADKLNQLVDIGGIWVWNWVAQEAAARQQMRAFVQQLPLGTQHYHTGPNHFYYNQPKR